MHVGALDKTLSRNTSWKASGETRIQDHPLGSPKLRVQHKQIQSEVKQTFFKNISFQIWRKKREKDILWDVNLAAEDFPLNACACFSSVYAIQYFTTVISLRDLVLRLENKPSPKHINNPAYWVTAL